MEIRAELIEALTLSIRKMRKDETFERALGKALRRRGLSFEDYVGLMSMIRDRAWRDGITYAEAASRIVSEVSGKEEVGKK